MDMTPEEIKTEIMDPLEKVLAWAITENKQRLAIEISKELLAWRKLQRKAKRAAGV